MFLTTNETFTTHLTFCSHKRFCFIQLLYVYSKNFRTLKKIQKPAIVVSFFHSIRPGLMCNQSNYSSSFPLQGNLTALVRKLNLCPHSEIINIFWRKAQLLSESVRQIYVEILPCFNIYFHIVIVSKFKETNFE